MATVSAYELLKRLDPLPPAIEARVMDGIRRHRMCRGMAKVTGPDGRPLAGVQVSMRQVRHAFHFGANCFMLDEAPSMELNARYESLFERLFNLTLVPLYWSDLEPEDGQLRLAIDSPHVFRRPSVERVLSWCESAGITPKAHPLVWQRFWPAWAPRDEGLVRMRLSSRIRTLAERFGARIQFWDVVNEALDIAHYPDVLPDDHVQWAFDQARAVLPSTASLYYNETVHSAFEDYRREYTPLYLLLQNLILRGAKLDGVGLQFHFWAAPEKAADRARRLLDPEHLLTCLDLYARLGRPIHISEVSLPTYDDEGLQAVLVRQLYRLWFSHQAVSGIVWWNLPDGGAETGAENGLGIGLLRPDYTPKAAWQALDDLINHEWHSEVAAETNADGEVAFEVFAGDYAIEAQHPDGVEVQHLRLATGSTAVTMRLGSAP